MLDSNGLVTDTNQGNEIERGTLDAKFLKDNSASTRKSLIIRIKGSESLNQYVEPIEIDLKSDSTGTSIQSFEYEGKLSSVTRMKYTPDTPVEALTNSELVQTVESLRKETKYLQLENSVLLNFLSKNDPSLVPEMDNLLQVVQTQFDRASISSRRLTFTRPSIDLGSGNRGSSSIFSPGVSEKEGARVNMNHKFDLVLREMEEIKKNLTKFNKQCYIKRGQLKAELEEINLRESELQDSVNTFNGVFISEVLKKYKQSNLAEKLIRFMEDRLKNGRLMMDKLRLRTSSIKVQHAKVCKQYRTKVEIGKNLEHVDFDQIRIENDHLIDKIEKRNLLLLELKRMNGRSNLMLSTNKQILLQKLSDMKTIEDNIKLYKGKLEKIDSECDKAALELYKTKSEYDILKQRTETYKVPEVMDYVKTKSELGALKKSLKTWTRRTEVKDLALLSVLREMKIVTGLRTRTSWFKEYNLGGRSRKSTFEFIFEKPQVPIITRPRSATKTSRGHNNNAK